MNADDFSLTCLTTLPRSTSRLQAEVLGQRITPDQVAGPLPLPLQVVVEDFPDLVAVQAPAAAGAPGTSRMYADFSCRRGANCFSSRSCMRRTDGIVYAALQRLAVVRIVPSRPP